KGRESVWPFAARLRNATAARSRLRALQAKERPSRYFSPSIILRDRPSPMTRSVRPITILMADDDADDRQMTQEAFAESHLHNDLRFVEDGVVLLDYLKRRGKFSHPSSSPRPGLILLDLNMPKKDGREALEEIKRDPELRTIRVVVLTTSKAEEDI